MKTLILTLLLSFSFILHTEAQTSPAKKGSTPSSSITKKNTNTPPLSAVGKKETVVLKKDGTPDKRFASSRKIKKDGTPDKRFKSNQ